MAGIPEEIIERVKAEANIVDVVSDYVRLRRTGKNWTGLCPFHDDKNPSLSVDKAKGLFHCFGCGESGDVFDLVMRMRSIPFREALEYLKKSELTPFVDAVSPQGDASVQQPAEALPEPEEPDPDASGESVLDTALVSSVLEKADLDDLVSYYERNLAGSTKAQKYLETRGLLDWELLKRLRAQ